MTDNGAAYVPARGDVITSKGGGRYVVDHAERNDDDCDRWRIRSLQWGLLLNRRYTLGDFRNGTLTPVGERMDFDAIAAQE